MRVESSWSMLSGWDPSWSTARQRLTNALDRRDRARRGRKKYFNIGV